MRASCMRGLSPCISVDDRLHASFWRERMREDVLLRLKLKLSLILPSCFLQWFDGELERPYYLHRARCVATDSINRQRFPTTPPPPYLPTRHHPLPLPTVVLVNPNTAQAFGSGGTVCAQGGSQADGGGEEEHKGPMGQGKGHHRGAEGNREDEGGLSISFLRRAKRCMTDDDEEEVQEEERAGVVAFVVTDLAPELYVELLDALRL